MNIVMIGFGKMGKLIAALAQQEGHTVISVDPQDKQAAHSTLSPEVIGQGDVCIDFTHPSVVMENIKTVMDNNKPLVVGTTGWYDQKDTVKKMVEEAKGSLMYASNFSIGMNMFFEIIAHSSKLINLFDEYDIAGLEYHHNQKADSPSGTAHSIGEILLHQIDRKKKLTFDKVDRQIGKEELHFASVRCGSIPGTHKVVYDAPADTLEITHCARNREGFAKGALHAAKWIQQKKGFYTISDMMNDILRG